MFFFFFVFVLFFLYAFGDLDVAEQPGVIQVVPSQTYQLHKPGGGGGFKLT
jgi:hypothetical protein